MRGRKRTPSYLKVIEGNPGKRRIPKPLSVEPILPEPPDHLDEIAKAEWRRVAKHLFRLRLLTPLDVGAAAVYCQGWNRLVQAERLLAEKAERDGVTHGLLIRGKHGTPVQNPLIGIARRSAATMMHVAAEFAMTPSARSRIGAGPNPPSSEFAGLLGDLDDEPA
ncbi:phage terminase small subunit P27 family [Mycobacterium sp. KBS0706]|uniref:phage terminase small subunit P27 family n=1 Tax=Mycobacterium sp. KBS0706 TaxID=2578109 RepID=UPI00163D57DC|nr:phage terminase small subunit P27 family [Mycobacterium sp. KBS0706]